MGASNRLALCALRYMLIVLLCYLQVGLDDLVDMYRRIFPHTLGSEGAKASPS